MVDRVLLVHPEDVNLADVKARAAELGVSVTGNVYVPRGQMFVTQPPSALLGS